MGELAEEQNHYSDVDFGWVRACLTTFTHKMDGHTESDFVFAAKVNKL